MRKASAPASFRALHRRLIIGAHAGGFDFGRRIEAMDGREILHDLDAAAMAVHIAEAADVHENVEADLLAGGKGTQQFVVLPAMAQAKIDDFAATRLAGGFDRMAQLPVRIMTVSVNKRGGEFDLEGVGVQRIVVEEINQRRGFDRAPCIKSAAACCSSRRVSISY
jgi:hypothetical protein